MRDGTAAPRTTVDRPHGVRSPRSARHLTEPDRIAGPGDLIDRVRPYFAAAGITRVAEVTGLDRIGIPVALAVRPNSRSLSVSQGKGVSRDQAVASAVMEALELAAAERLPESLTRANCQEIGAAGSTAIDLALSTRCRLDRLGRHDELLWIGGYELGSGRPIMVPWSLVGIDYRVNPRGFHFAFQVSTDGLASGRSEEEAILHALCELIERDATALLEFTATEELSQRVYAIDRDDAPEIQRLKAMIERAGCRLTVIDMTTDLAVPAFTAIISDCAGDDAAPVTQYAHSGGSGCHPLRAQALRKAIVEAAQSRITRITGSRDDLPANLYCAAEEGDAKSIAGLLSFADQAPGGRAKAVHPDLGAGPEAPAESIARLLDGLRRHGIVQIAVVPIANDFGISVVRLIVPGLQTELTGSRSKLGRRALAKLVGRLQ